MIRVLSIRLLAFLGACADCSCKFKKFFAWAIPNGAEADTKEEELRAFDSMIAEACVRVLSVVLSS